MQDVEYPQAQGLGPCEDWWGVIRGLMRGKNPQGNAGQRIP